MRFYFEVSSKVRSGKNSVKVRIRSGIQTPDTNTGYKAGYKIFPDGITLHDLRSNY